MFSHEYLIFDEFGLKQVLCLACSKPIKTRSELKSDLYPKLVVRELARHADYREIPILLKNGRIAFIMVCDECKFVNIGEKEAEDISLQLNAGLKLQLEYEGKLPDLIEQILINRNLKVLRKAEVLEVTAALRGV